MPKWSEGDQISSVLSRLDVEFLRSEDEAQRQGEPNGQTSMAGTDIVVLFIGAASVTAVWLGLFIWVLIGMIGPRYGLLK